MLKAQCSRLNAQAGFLRFQQSSQSHDNAVPTLVKYGPSLIFTDGEFGHGNSNVTVRVKGKERYAVDEAASRSKVPDPGTR